jgi:hypothetical protein
MSRAPFQVLVFLDWIAPEQKGEARIADVTRGQPMLYSEEGR